MEKRSFSCHKSPANAKHADLARASVNLQCRFGFELASEDASIGTVISFFGYLTGYGSNPQASYGNRKIETLASYFDNPYDEFRPPPPSYRFSSKAYSGVSGSPVIDATSQKLIGVIWGQEWAQENKDIDEMLDAEDGGSMLLGMGEGQGGTAYTTVALISLMNETTFVKTN